MFQKCGKDYGAIKQHDIQTLKEISSQLKIVYFPRADKKEKEHKRLDIFPTLPSPIQLAKIGLKIKRKASMERNTFFKLYVN